MHFYKNKFSVCALILTVFTLTFTLLSSAFAQEQEPIVFGVGENSPPYSYLENGQPKGIMIDVIHALEKQLNRPIVIQFMEWSTAQTMLEQGKLDAIGPMSATDERKALFEFTSSLTIPAFETSTSIFVRNNSIGISTLEDLHSLKVGVIDGNLSMQLVKSDPKINMVVSSGTLLSLFKQLNNGEIDAVVADAWIGNFTLAQYGYANIHITGKPIATLHSGIVVKKGNAQLADQLSAGIKALQLNHTLDAIEAKWKPMEIVVQTREQVAQKTYYFTVALLLVLLIGTVGWIITMKREVSERKKSEEALKFNRQRLTQLTAHIEQIKEQQRMGIARELHDELGGNLVAVKMVMQSMSNRLTPDQTWLKEKFHYVETLIDRTIESGHRIVHELRPGILDLGIIPALEWQAKEFQKQNNITCQFTTDSSDINVLPAHATAIYRMVQEALTNIAKHAKATRASITIIHKFSRLTIMIEDNGVGLEPDIDGHPNSFGLLGMSERCNAIGGELSIQSEPNNGCMLTIKIPLTT